MAAIANKVTLGVGVQEEFSGGKGMTKWTLLLLVLCLALAGQSQDPVRDRELELHARPFNHNAPMRVIGGQVIERRGSIEVRQPALIQMPNISVIADQMEWDSRTDLIHLKGNVLVKLGPPPK
jgi:hypothetical protein